MKMDKKEYKSISQEAHNSMVGNEWGKLVNKFLKETKENIQ